MISLFTGSIITGSASFYPFAPREKERDVEIEYRLRMLVMDELPVDSLDYWFPVWGIPF